MMDYLAGSTEQKGLKEELFKIGLIILAITKYVLTNLHYHGVQGVGLLIILDNLNNKSLFNVVQVNTPNFKEFALNPSQHGT